MGDTAIAKAHVCGLGALRVASIVRSPMNRRCSNALGRIPRTARLAEATVKKFFAWTMVQRAGAQSSAVRSSHIVLLVLPKADTGPDVCTGCRWHCRIIHTDLHSS